MVLRHGSRPDVEALLPVFLDDPGAREELVPIGAMDAITPNSSADMGMTRSRSPFGWSDYE
ncbi:hypothetical protein ACFVYE_32885 [Streptomyces sp. NPDC058239]|uniref:hypothetical protein n=1 Tax=Streptomyces sp. NPDC058239 TaxID=3346395 RepID=UPI0036E5735D